MKTGEIQLEYLIFMDWCQAKQGRVIRLKPWFLGKSFLILAGKKRKNLQTGDK